MRNPLRIIGITLLSILIATFVAAPGASAWVSGDVAVSVFGGASNEETLSIKVDNNGNIFSAGFFSGTADFNPGIGSESLTSQGSLDIFISKLDSSGNFLWAKRIGGLGGEVAKSIGVDNTGNVFIAGDFSGTVDFDPGVETATLTSSGEGDVFLLKLDPSGNYVWAKSFGGTTADSGIFISVDPQGNSVVTGLFSGTVDFDPSVATFNLSSVGGWDIYVSKFNSSGNFQWSRSRGGRGTDIGDAVGFDSNGNVYSSGVFSGEVDFNPGTETVTLTSSGSNDMFISKFDSAGNYLWAKRFGGTGADGSTPISVDGTGNIYLSGDFSGTVDFYPGEQSALITSTGTKDNFIVKLDSSGGYLWSKHFGSSGASTSGARTAIDSSGNVFYTGDFIGTIDFDPSVGEANLASAGLSDIFISKLDSSGGYLWAKSVGGTSADRGQAIAVDTSGNVYSTGYFNGLADFYPGGETMGLTSAGGRDVYISELNSSGNVLISSLARVITPAEAAEAAARAAAAAKAAAAKAAADAAAVQREAEKQSARANLVTTIKDAKELTVDSFAKAQIPGINASNISAVQAELLALPEESRNDINQVLKVARKYEVVGVIASDQVKSIPTKTFVEIGLIPEASKNKAALAMAVKKLPADARDSLAEIKAAIEAESVRIAKRADRLAKILTPKSSRNGK